MVCSGSSIQNKQMFNIICELPETVARTLVPRMRVVKGTGRAISYLTPPRILLALVTAWLRRERWFDAQVIFIILWKHLTLPAGAQLWVLTARGVSYQVANCKKKFLVPFMIECECIRWLDKLILTLIPLNLNWTEGGEIRFLFPLFLY